MSIKINDKVWVTSTKSYKKVIDIEHYENVSVFYMDDKTAYPHNEVFICKPKIKKTNCKSPKKDFLSKEDQVVELFSSLPKKVINEVISEEIKKFFEKLNK